MKSLAQWLNEYSVSHQNPTNKKIHWVCVPTIFFTVVCFLLTLLPEPLGLVLLGVLSVFYLRLSWRLFLGMCIWLSTFIVAAYALEAAIAPTPLWQLSLLIFIVAWIGQFVGHHIEGKKPSFFQDLQFLMIGPAWCLNFVFQKLGINL